MKSEILNTVSNESYRDSMSIVSKEGKRLWIYPKKPKGRFYNARSIVAFLLLAFLFVTPFIKVNGHPIFLFNILDRKFILFGLTFGPHDFYIFAITVIAFVVFIILFTVIFGRVFCGWICPQTVLMEMVFRKIEYWLEGDASRQKELNAAPGTFNKIMRKYSKYLIFFALSFFIANFMLAFIIGIDELWKIVSDPPAQHFAGLISMLLFTTLFYWIFAWFREQACIMVCPYGRLQGVLLDQNSMVIAYDHVRGEPRGKLSKSEARTSGDCVDCKLCVDVCPTGIDIRNGTQLECVNCTACIDACDNVMDKINKPRGLIKFASANGILNRTKFKITTRVVSYSIVLIILVGVLTILLTNRKDIDVTILRAPGMLFQEQPGNKISNLYNIDVTNKTFKDESLSLKLENVQGELKVIGNELNIKANEVSEAKFLVLLDKADIKKMNTPLAIGVYDKGRKIDELTTTFLGPKPN
jgi:cytochrome c oxidase accessory protein FixG